MRTLLVLLFLCLAQTAQALCNGASFMDRLTPDQRTRIETAAAQTPYGTGLLWRAKRGDHEIIVIGTMHIYDPRLEQIFARIKDEIARADILLVEATKKEQDALQRVIAETPNMAFITDGPTLPERLDEDLWESIKNASRARQLPPFMAAKMQPWYLALTFAIPPCAIFDLATGIQGLDHMIMAEAEAQNVPMAALEPYTTLLDAMQDGTFEEQVEMLRLSLLSPEIHSEMFVAMLDAYFAEEIALVWEASRLTADFVPDLDPKLGAELFAQSEQILLVDRNLAWMPVINANLAPKTIVAAGAAHLMGETGILRLLEAEGWTITPY